MDTSDERSGGMDSRRKNLETESIKAVLEAQRAKIAALRRDQQRPIWTGESGDTLTKETSSMATSTTKSGNDVIVHGSQALKECLEVSYSGAEFPVGKLFDDQQEEVWQETGVTVRIKKKS